ncbi:hypothetical protein A4X13_0g9077 [Tilletia indica]|uniref:Uncharacterized protein n=1 Tax=Tilletia indica TaxID=43049 RepID=A0A177T3I4_9BASI|nr:hypothetical protein A4X13_0g9077 [Tilletia indica]
MAEIQNQNQAHAAQAEATAAMATSMRESARMLAEEIRAMREGNANPVEQVGLPSFLMDPNHEDTVVEPWPGAFFTVPGDVVELIKTGSRPPLIWLTVEALVTSDDGETRSPLTFPLSGKHKERVTTAIRKDAFLPRGATHQALQVLASVCRALSPPTNDADRSPAVLLEEMHLNILTRATDEHWTVWREYIKRCLDAIWAKRKPGVGMAFDIGKIDDSTLAKAELYCGKAKGFIDTFTSTKETLVYALLRAEGDAINEVGKTMEDIRVMGVYGPPPPPPPPVLPHAKSISGVLAVAHAPSQHKRKDREGDIGPFQRASSSYTPRDGDANPPKGPRAGNDRTDRRAALFCTACVRWGDHDFRVCKQALAPELENLGKMGWRWKGKSVPFCDRFNRAVDCMPAGNCTFGHYCSKCGTQGHAAVNCHGSI